jgi:hypothetical protein
MKLHKLEALARARNCRVEWREIRNGNNPFFGKRALFIYSDANGRSTHYVGHYIPEEAQRLAAEWIVRNTVGEMK